MNSSLELALGDTQESIRLITKYWDGLEHLERQGDTDSVSFSDVRRPSKFVLQKELQQLKSIETQLQKRLGAMPTSPQSATTTGKEKCLLCRDDEVTSCLE